MSNFALTVEYYKKLPDGTRECSESSVPVGDNQSIEFKLPRNEPGTLVTTVWDKDGKQVSKAGESIGPGSFIITCFGNGDAHAVNPGGCAKWYDTENGLVLDQGTYDLGQVDREPGTGTTFQTANGSQYVMAPTGQTYQLQGGEPTGGKESTVTVAPVADRSTSIPIKEVWFTTQHADAFEKQSDAMLRPYI